MDCYYQQQPASHLVTVVGMRTNVVKITFLDGKVKNEQEVASNPDAEDRRCLKV